MNDQFIIENLQYVFGVDALETSRPINIEVNTPAEINSMFDAISYEKGWINDVNLLYLFTWIPKNDSIWNRILRDPNVRGFYRLRHIPARSHSLPQRQV